MTSDRAVMAVLLRETEWLLADAAHRIPQESFGVEECRALVEVLDRLSVALRQRFGDGVVPPVVGTREVEG